MASIWIISAILLTLSGVTLCQFLNESKLLMTELLTDYDKRHRPLLNQSASIELQFGLELIAIQDFDQVTERFAVVGLLSLTWYDEMIDWDPDWVGGISSMQFPVKEVWYPNIQLANPSSEMKRIIQDWMSVRIYYTGEAWITTGDVFKVTCSIDVTYYPFDKQKCAINFVPFGYNAKEIELNADKSNIRLEEYSPNGEWVLENYYIYTEFEFNTTVIYFVFEMERKSLFLVVNILMPIILLALMNSMTFLLPSGSGERVSYAITVLLALGVFLTLVGENLPKKSEPMSLMSWFLLGILIISTGTCFMAIFNTRLYFREDDEHVPKWIAYLTRVIACRNFRRSCKKGRIDHTDTTNKAFPNVRLADLEDENVKSVQNYDDETDKIIENHHITWREVSETLDSFCLLLFTISTFVCIALFVIIVPSNTSAFT